MVVPRYIYYIILMRPCQAVLQISCTKNFMQKFFSQSVTNAKENLNACDILVVDERTTKART